jgi:hypothetical protein
MAGRLEGDDLAVAAAGLGHTFGDHVVSLDDDRSDRRLGIRAAVRGGREVERALKERHASACTSRRYARGRSSRPKMADPATKSVAPAS